jgi:hypothetical protein
MISFKTASTLLATAAVLSLAPTLGIASAQAASVGTTTTNCDFTGAAVCTSVFGGNDSADNLNGINDSPFLNFTWTVFSKINFPKEADIGNQFFPDQGNTNAFKMIVGTLKDDEEPIGGSWTVFQNIIGNNPFVLAMKSGNSVAYNFFSAGPYSGAWDTQRFGNKGISHATLYVANNPPTPVPTPALLPGLVGLGVAALRKRKGEAEESAEA